MNTPGPMDHQPMNPALTLSGNNTDTAVIKLRVIISSY